MVENKEFARELINELRRMRTKAPYQPTADLDLVWVVSQPGTVLQNSNDGIYKGISNDLLVVRAGIEIIRRVTALRAGKDIEFVTREDVSEFGPILFYNGEDATTPKHGYTQNEDLEAMISEPDFPIPRSRVVVDHIDQIGTPAQVIGFARFLREHQEIKKIAVVSMAPHSIRVSRYLQHRINSYPEGIVLENACVAEKRIPVGSVIREINKVTKYYELGHLAKEPYF